MPCINKCISKTSRRNIKKFQVVPVAVRSEAWVCGRSFIGIAGSDCAGGMHASLYLVSVVCCQVEVSATS
jgi:hypothetical protein